MKSDNFQECLQNTYCWKPHSWERKGCHCVTFTIHESDKTEQTPGTAYTVCLYTICWLNEKICCVPCLSKICTCIQSGQLAFWKAVLGFSEKKLILQLAWEISISNIDKGQCLWECLVPEGSKDLEFPVHFSIKFSPIFSAVIRFIKKKKRAGERFSYFKPGFTYLLPLKIKFAFDSVLAVKFCKIACMQFEQLFNTIPWHTGLKQSQV